MIFWKSALGIDKKKRLTAFIVCITVFMGALLSACSPNTEKPTDQNEEIPAPGEDEEQQNDSTSRGDEKQVSEDAISELRPRIFLRADEAIVGRGTTVSEMRLRIKNSEYQEWFSYMGGIQGWHQLPAVALRYLIMGQKKDALDIGNYLANQPFPQDITSCAGAYGAIAFDWVRKDLPEDVAQKAVAKLVEGAEYLKSNLESPAINHNYTYVSLYGLSMIALSIYGEGDANTQKAEEYMDLVREMLEGEGMMLDTFREKGGTWGEGNHYSMYVVFSPFLSTLYGLTTATGTDYFQLIREDYDNFIEPMAKYIIANFRPDFTLERIGDMGSRWVNPKGTQMRPMLELLAAEQKDSILTGQIRSFCKEMAARYGSGHVPSYYGWMMMSLYNADLPNEPSYKTLPLAMRFGEGSYEHIMFRSSWEEDGTLITYISGDHYTDHQHFDRGNFLIYHKGALVSDAGAYSNMYGNHWSNYACRTLAHNNVLIYDPDEAPYEGIAGTIIYPDGGQKVLRGVQTHKNWADYLRIQEQNGMNTAEVMAFDFDRESNRYGYVKSDLTQAYSDKAEWVDRQIVYLPQVDFIVIKDRVISKETADKYWLLHFNECPWVDNKQAETGINDYRNGEVVRAQRRGELDLGGSTIPYGGGILVKPILPKDRIISTVGGEGYEFYNRFVEKNFFDDSEDKNAFDPIREPGNWRMEVKPSEASKETVFLNAISITDAGTVDMTPTEYIQSQDEKMEGVLFLSNKEHQLVLFQAGVNGYEQGSPVSLPVNYTIQTFAPTTHVLAELEPGKKVKVEVNGQAIGEYETSEAGVLIFRDTGTGQREIAIKAQ
jgi:hypothetical protein